jgi:hypothetical protein
MGLTPRYYEHVGKTLKQFLKDGTVWDRIPTTMSGVFLIILPTQDFGLEILPVDKWGKIMRSRGIIIKHKEILIDFIRIFAQPKLLDIMDLIQEFHQENKTEQLLSKEILDLGDKPTVMEEAIEDTQKESEDHDAED